jgi:hypothetical protein
VVSNLFELFQKNFSHWYKTLKDISYDKENSVYLISIEDQHFSYDDIVDEYFANHGNEEIKKFDALLFGDERICCIEFKNSTPRRINNKEVRGKACEGYASLSKICHDHDVSLKNYKLFYVVVYKSPQTNNRAKVASRLNNPTYFGLKRYKNKFYDNVFTVDNMRFERLYNTCNHSVRKSEQSPDLLS